MQSKSAFVLMPFSPEFDDVYDFLIKTPLESAGYNVSRADDLLNQNNILQDIISGIVNCDLVIADLSMSNPNVYYEVGLAHAVKKKVVLITQDIEEVPFDLRSYRIITYSMHFSKMNDAQRTIGELVQKELNNELTFSSPVVDYGATNPGIFESNSMSATGMVESSSQRGILDIQVDLGESNDLMGQVMSEVSEWWVKLTPTIQLATESLNNKDGKSSKEQRSVMRNLAKELDDFTEWLKTENVKYKAALLVSKECLDELFSNKFNVTGSKPELIDFVNTLGNTADAAIAGKNSFMGLVETMDGLPKIEKQFDLSNKKMSIETKILIENVDQTASILSRARLAAKNLLDD